MFDLKNDVAINVVYKHCKKLKGKVGMALQKSKGIRIVGILKYMLHLLSNDISMKISRDVTYFSYYSCYYIFL